jgi:alkanesulfonate monooxygenase SsuD/methylene tetrahydromethanopterin reductase-like flavin-dependent oxidoreductase (luciferase family)
MRVLLDQCTPAPIREYLTKHQVSTAHEQGWSTLLNGNLIKAAEDAGFEVLLTADTHMMNQQNLAQTKLAIIALSTNHWKSILAAVNLIVVAVDTAKPGLSWVQIPSSKI